MHTEIWHHMMSGVCFKMICWDWAHTQSIRQERADGYEWIRLVMYWWVLKLDVDIILFLNMLEIFFDKELKKERQLSVPLCCCTQCSVFGQSISGNRNAQKCGWAIDRAGTNVPGWGTSKSPRQGDGRCVEGISSKSNVTEKSEMIKGKQCQIRV